MKRTFALLLIAILSVQFASAQDDNGKSSEDILINYYDQDFKPYKNGVWYLAMTLSLSDQSLKNSRLGLFDDVIEGDNSDWTLDFTTGRYISDYFLVGINIGMQQATFEGTLNGSLGIPFRRKNQSDLFTVGAYIRTSIPLTKNSRLSFYNDLGFGLGFGENKLEENRGGNSSVSKADIFKFGVGINPGITYFAVNNVAFEAGVNLIGYEYAREKGQNADGEDTFNESHNVNFSVSLLSINMGISYFFGTKRN